MKLRCPVCHNEVPFNQHGKGFVATCPWHCSFSIRLGALAEAEAQAVLSDSNIIKIEEAKNANKTDRDTMPTVSGKVLD